MNGPLQMKIPCKKSGINTIKTVIMQIPCKKSGINTIKTVIMKIPCKKSGIKTIKTVIMKIQSYQNVKTNITFKKKTSKKQIK